MTYFDRISQTDHVQSNSLNVQDTPTLKKLHVKNVIGQYHSPVINTEFGLADDDARVDKKTSWPAFSIMGFAFLSIFLFTNMEGIVEKHMTRGELNEPKITRRI